jgi:DNA-binding transcriptional LysR family regulator
MLPQLDVRHLYSVVVLAEELNFTRAAHRLRISQPAFSRQITALEKQYGFQLVVRDRKRGTQLTEAGRMFVEEARSALLHADRAIHLARAAHHGYDNVLLVGHPTHADHSRISTLLTIRLPLFPKLKVRLTTDFGTLIWPHFGRLNWPHLIYSDRSSYSVPASQGRGGRWTGDVRWNCLNRSGGSTVLG